MSVRSMEDYLEKIYLLIEAKGHARVFDIAKIMDVKPSSVTKMIQKLDHNNYLIYEKYHGFRLTPSGQTMGKQLVFKHQLLENFFRIIGVDEKRICKEVAEIKHRLSSETIDRIFNLVQYFQEDEQRIEALKEFQRNHKSDETLF